MPVAVRPRPEKRNLNRAPATQTRPQKRRTHAGQFTVVESISRPSPQWLPWVMALEKMTRPLALLSLTSVLVIYGIHVVKQREWSTAYESLEHLQTQRSVLVNQSERQKYQVPRSLEVAPKNYVELNQERALFMKPDPQRSIKEVVPQPRHSQLREDRLPVGY